MAESQPASKPVVQVRGLSKSYLQGPKRVDVLKELDLSIAAGEFAAILGPSGSGKTTLLNLIGLMDAPSAGEVMLHGRRANTLSEPRRAELRSKRLGFVFQFDSLLPEFTVMENVSMPARIAGRSLSKASRQGADLLASLGIAETGGRFPTELSGGERQRAAIARALINAPDILLADEPTGNLDRENAVIVFEKLHQLSKELGVAVLLVTHNEEAARYAARSIRLRDGRIE